MRPFLLLATRAEDEAADQEYAAFVRFGGLAPDQLVRRRLEAAPLGAVHLDDWSGIILGGSPFTVSDDADTKSEIQVRVEQELKELVDAVVERDFPFLGACYGIGTLGTLCGAVVDRTYTEPVSAPLVTLTEAGRADPLLGVLPETFEAFVGHKEAITTLPAGIESLASTAGCPVQAFRVGANVYATQFHPELDAAGIITRIEAYKNYGYFAPERAESLKEMARASNVRHPARLVRRFVELYQRP